jgi:hypothetical protein
MDKREKETVYLSQLEGLQRTATISSSNTLQPVLHKGLLFRRHTGTPSRVTFLWNGMARYRAESHWDRL